jgi:ATP-dependent exoDNAse (exonuclease V) beta subunit
VLPPEAEEHAPLRHQRLLELDLAGAAAASEASYLAWKNEREALLAIASQPTLQVQTVTALARKKSAEASGGVAAVRADPIVRVEWVTRSDATRPAGRRFGALVHTVLASIDLSDPDAIQQSAVMNGKMVGASDNEIAAAVMAVRNALAHPVLRRAATRANNGLRREAPVTLRLDDGSLVEGVIDLAYPDDDSESSGWTVVDFKTDREFSASSERYVAQVQLYAQALERVMNSPAKAVLLVL